MSVFLIISPEPWTAHAVSKHHYALALAARGHEVLFLNPPTAGRDLTISYAAETSGVRVVDGPPVARGLRYMPAALRRMLEARWLEQLEVRCGTLIDAVWLFENSRFFDMTFAGDRLKIYHQVDLNQEFHPHIAARTSDICFCTTDVIRNTLLRSSRRVHKIHHGTPRIAVRVPLTTIQRERFSHGGLNAAYVGNLGLEYLDADLLLATITAYPSVRFHLIGGYSEHLRLRYSTQRLANVVWWGQQPSTLIPSLLEEVDVVMCTYQARRYRDQLASPHKFMEYFASGNVIVSTYTDEYRDKRDLLCMVDDPDDYISVFGNVIADLRSYNSTDQRARRRNFAEMHSYDAQLDKISELVARTSPRNASLFPTANKRELLDGLS